MAREDCSERGLPSAEVRRQILKRAGTILDEARDLMARLDKCETSSPGTLYQNQQTLERMANDHRCLLPLQAAPPVSLAGSPRSMIPDQALAA